MTFRLLALSSALTAALVAGACASAPRAPADEAPAGRTGFATGRTERFPATADLRLGDVPMERLSALAPRVASLRATPSEIRVKLGDTILIRDVVRVLLLDSAGTSLGTLPLTDTRLTGARIANLVQATRVAGLAAGEAMLRLSFPRMMWNGRPEPRPFVDIPVRVTQNGPSSPVISPLIREATGGAFLANTGSGSGDCQLNSPPPPSTPRDLARRIRSELERRRVECSYIDGSEGSDRARRQWLRAVVLARSDSGTRRPQGPMTMQEEQEMMRRFETRMMSRMTPDGSRRMPMGGAGDFRDPDLAYEVSQGMDTIFLADRAFAVPRRDSALVILIDRHDRQRAPTIVGTVMMSAALPADFWSKMWRNGDTTFIVSPKRDNTYLRDALTAVPAIRAFLP